MSDTIVVLSNNQVKSTVPLLRIEALTPGSQYSISSPSPDSNSSVSNLSDREANSCPDMNIPEYCLSNGSFVDDSYNSGLPNLNQTFITTPVNSSGNFWNENLSLMSNRETGLHKCQTFQDPGDGSGSGVTSPDSAGRESQLSSAETSQRGSIENDCCSLSSGEMVIRSNSYDDQSPLAVSFLDESFIPLAAAHPKSPAESNLLSAAMPDVLENFTERVTEENTDCACFGMTFTQADLSTEENDMATSNSFVTLPSENEGGLLMTFLCESSPPDCGTEVPLANVDAELVPCLPGVFTPEQGKTLLSTLSATQQTDLDMHTSTPVQPGNLMPSLPSFPESPCTGNACSPILHPVKQQQVSVTANGLVAGRSPPVGKVKKLEIKKFQKSNFSSVKSKVVTKSIHRSSMASPASVHKPSQANVNNKPIVAQSRAPRSSAAVLSTTTEMVNDPQRRVNKEAANLGETILQLGNASVDEPGTSRESPLNQHPVANKHAPAVQCSNPSSEAEQAASDQMADAAALRPAKQTLCFSSMRKKTNGGQTDPKPTSKKVVLKKIDLSSGSASGDHKPPVLKIRTRCSSDSLSWSSRQSDIHVGLTKGNLSGSSLNTLTTNAQSKISPRDVKRISLVAESSKSTTAGVSSDESRSRFGGRPFPRQSMGTPHSQPPAASPRTANLTTRRWQVSQWRDENRTSKAVGTPQSKQKSSTGSQRGQATGEPSLGTASTASIKPQLHGSRPPQTPTRPSLMGPPPTPSRLPRRTLGPSGTFAEAGGPTVLSEGSASTQVSARPPHKPSPFKTVLKARLITTPGKNTGPSLATACKPAALISKGSSNSLMGPLRRTASARLRLTSSAPEMLWSPKLSLSNIHVRLTAKGLLRNLQLLSGCRKNTMVFQTVDKSKPKATPRQQQAPQANQRSGPPDVVPASVAEGEEKDQSLQQLTALLAASNCRFQAFAIVLQRTLAERDEATKRSSDLCQELASLRGELVCSVHSSERLEREKDELRVALQDALHKLQEKHHNDMVDLEQRLKVFYQAEWDKVHLTYQEEADKCKTLMQQQLEELKANHEAIKLELGSSHAEQLQAVKQQYDISLEELSKVHNQELQSLEKALKETGAALSGRITELTVENDALVEKLAAVDNRRKRLPEKSQMSPQKDSHTQYLEQELESLKVVLDIKNKQLHQQEKKMMEIATLTEKNVKLYESLQKVEQENEDLKARMEKHYTLSRQLSTEQALLHESLQKESIVNKRLSMENEELIWKLHNGDLSRHAKVSPTSSSSSSSQSFNLQSPHSPGVLSSPPVSPR